MTWTELRADSAFYLLHGADDPPLASPPSTGASPPSLTHAQLCGAPSRFVFFQFLGPQLSSGFPGFFPPPPLICISPTFHFLAVGCPDEARGPTSSPPSPCSCLWAAGQSGPLPLPVFSSQGSLASLPVAAGSHRVPSSVPCPPASVRPQDLPLAFLEGEAAPWPQLSSPALTATCGVGVAKSANSFTTCRPPL